MFDPADISRLRQAVATYAKAFDADVITAVDAVVVVDEAARIEKMAATLKALAGARAADANVLERDGDLSPAHALARRTGTTVGKAADALRTAKRLRSQPALDAAARSGDVSPEQAAAIADASAANPAAETRLVEKSRQASLAELRNECEREKAAADRDAEERHKRIHAARYARRRSCPDGSGEIVYRSTRDEIAEVWATIVGYANEAFNRARLAGQHEPSDAYVADGVLGMARAAARSAVDSAAGRGSKAKGRDTAPDGPANCSGDVPTPPAATGSSATTPTPAEQNGAGTATDDASGEAAPAGAGATAEGTPDTAGPAGSGSSTNGSAVDSGPAEPGPWVDGASDEPAAPSAGPGVATLPGLAAMEEAQRSPVLPQATGPPKSTQPPGQARSPVPTKIVVRIDLPALLRGWVEGDEICDIAGIGPVAVSAVRAMIETGDPFLAAVVTKGVDVVSVAHLGRRPNAYQRTALDWLAPTCRVIGCDAAARLEYDHRHDWADTHVTLLAWLDRLCDPHHDKKTYDGWALVAGTGKRPMVPPNDPRHPRHLRLEPEGGA